MKILKIVGIVLVSLIVLVLVVAALTKKDYALEREVVINKPKQEVFDYVKLLKNQDNFSVWAQMDPNMKKEYRGVDGTVGFVSAWESQKDDVGKGEQEIAQIVEGEKIDYNLHFIKPFEGLAKSTLKTEEVSATETKVKWAFSSSMPYPMNIMLLCMDMEGMLGKSLQDGLNNLKTILEK